MPEPRLKKWGVWNKELGLAREIVRLHALLAGIDFLVLLALLLIIGTVYRVPSLISSMARNGTFNLLRGSTQRIVATQVRSLSCGGPSPAGCILCAVRQTLRTERLSAHAVG